MGNTESIEGGSYCCNMRDIDARSNKTYVDDKTVVMDIKNYISDICTLAPGSPSCKAAKKHLEYMENSIDNNKSLQCSSDNTIDVFASVCPYVQDTNTADQCQVTGICNPVKVIDVMKYVEKIAEKYPEKKQTKNISSNPMINKVASITNCDSEACVLSTVAKTYKIDTSADGELKPDGPKDSTEWLSNDHTDNILKDLEKEFEEFFWFQTTMMNFEDDHLKRFLRISDGKNLRYSDTIIIDELDNGKNCFGCIINTDKTTQCKNGKCGSHWVCVFIDCRKLPDSPWTIEYFDSVGDPPPNEICHWQEKLRRVFEKHRKEKGHTGGVICDINNIGHQKQNNECGVYCSYFIRARVEGIPFSRFKNRKLPDMVMIQYRRYLFSRNK